MTFSEFKSGNLTKLLILFSVISAIIYISYLFWDIILLLAVSLLLAMIFNPMVKILEKNNVPKLGSILSVFIISGIIIFVGLSVLIPKIINQLNTIAGELTEDNIALFFNQIESAVSSYIPFIDSADLAEKLSNFFSTLIFDSVNNISQIVSSIVSVISISIIVPFMTFFILKDSQKIIRGFLNFMPNRYLEVSYWVIWKIRFQLGRFVRGWIFDAMFVGALSAIGLSILGIQNSITIGVVAGIGHLIPYFGPLIGGLPAIIISVIQFGDLSKLPSILILFLIIYTIDNGYVQPKVFSKSTDMHPLAIILLILVGSQLLGIIGMLLAVPVATVLKTASRETYYGYKNYKIIRLS